MPLQPPIEYEHATPEVLTVYDDIRATRKTEFINNFWKALANHPTTLASTWAATKQVMAPGALDPLVKELLYLAVSVTNGCTYCTHTHTAAAVGKGLTASMFSEMMAVVALANGNNRLANGYGMEVDERFRDPLAKAAA